MSYFDDLYEDSLAHHGRLKQKWGERNGPPYPLESKQITPAQRKADPTVYSDRGRTERRPQRGSPRNSTNAKRTVSTVRGSNASYNTRKMSSHKMSDKDLLDATARLRAEKEYRDLMAEVYPASSANAKNVFARVMSKSAEKAATTVVTGALTYGAKEVIAAAFGDDVAREIIGNGKAANKQRDKDKYRD